MGSGSNASERIDFDTSSGDGGSITAFADATGGGAGDFVDATSTNHGLSVGQVVVIAGTTNYDGRHPVTAVDDANTFEFADTWVATETGTWRRLLYLELAATGYIKSDAPFETLSFYQQITSLGYYYFDDADVAGGADIFYNCPTTRDCGMQFRVNSGAPARIDMFSISTTDAGLSTTFIGDASGAYLAVDENGAMAWVGGASNFVISGSGGMNFNSTGGISLGTTGYLQLPSSSIIAIDALGKIGIDTNNSGVGGDQLVYFDDTDSAVVPYVQQPCEVYDSITSASDDTILWMNTAYVDVTLISASCVCVGDCTTPADISLEIDEFNADDPPNDVTGAVDCGDSQAVDPDQSNQALTGNTNADQFDVIRFDVDNTPTTGDQYIVCLNYELVRQ
jgi:hypothetical protein